jgi:gluconate 2-dehydrogenase gamma chain
LRPTSLGCTIMPVIARRGNSAAAINKIQSNKKLWGGRYAERNRAPCAPRRLASKSVQAGRARRCSRRHLRDGAGGGDRGRGAGSRPRATEARAAHYIDRALTGPLRASRGVYAAGLAAIDVYAQSAKGAAFAKLAVADQDAVLADMEKNVAIGFAPDAATFFNLVRTHTIQGTFCDPYYGGNADFVGWDLIGYPGLRLVVTADEQRMNVRAKPVRQSAYADATFTMKGGSHGHRP